MGVKTMNFYRRSGRSKRGKHSPRSVFNVFRRSGVGRRPPRWVNRTESRAFASAVRHAGPSKKQTREVYGAQYDKEHEPTNQGKLHKTLTLVPHVVFSQTLGLSQHHHLCRSSDAYRVHADGRAKEQRQIVCDRDTDSGALCRL